MLSQCDQNFDNTTIKKISVQRCDQLRTDDLKKKEYRAPPVRSDILYIHTEP